MYYKLGTLALLLTFTSPAQADRIGPLFDKIAEMDGSTYENYSGFLFKRWVQFDENNIRYVLYINDRKYDVILDDGRETSKRAKTCPKGNMSVQNPNTGCAINFDGEYSVEDNSGSIEVDTKIWNVQFLD